MRWVRIPDGTKVRFREDGREGIIDGLTELVVGPRRNPDCRTAVPASTPEIPTWHLQLRTIYWS